LVATGREFDVERYLSKMGKRKLHQIKTINEYHRLRGWPQPTHPLISLVDMAIPGNLPELNMVTNFYSICIKRSANFKMKYGQQEYDFDSGVMYFMSPNQVFNLFSPEKEQPMISGWLLLIHPDFLWNTSLINNINKYEFFDYSANEALFLSEKEQEIIDGIIKNIRQECDTNIDKFSKQIIISHVETLLNYADRFYNRQFITREKSNHQIIIRLEKLLVDYFNREDIITQGLPTVQFIADALHVSPKYLGNMLRAMTGQNTQQHIHEKLIAKAKEKLSTTNLSVGEIAYSLGFAHVQSFSRLFKAKTNQSPFEFRQSFN
jgi:AraC family transcriptional regulator, transcriptional activator of pobA